MNANLRPLIILLLGTLYLTTTLAYRQKRLSDTRLAELETQMNLKKIRDEARMHKPGFGLRDPHQIGRKRRAPSGLVGILDGSERGDGGRPGAERAWYPGLERIYRSSLAAYPKYPRDQLDLERLSLYLQEPPPNGDLFPR
uniref:SWI/SNF complex subunit SWI3C n=1 Tax=Lygus hesperus TaxID=30085 RepID=A0A0A9XEL5_LYGHE